MSSNKHPFQQWLDDNGVDDVRFFPANPDNSAPSELLDEAYSAVCEYQDGKTVPYEDNIQERSQ